MVLPRYQRLKRRDWKDPFEWFRWQQFAFTGAGPITRLAEDGTTRLAENDVTRTSEGY